MISGQEVMAEKEALPPQSALQFIASFDVGQCVDGSAGEPTDSLSRALVPVQGSGSLSLALAEGGAEVPFRQLEVETNLNESVADIAEYHKQLAVRLTNGQYELASSGEDIPVGEDIDFLGPADNIKTLFKIPYSSSSVSLAVHKLGQTLIVDGEVDYEDIKAHTRQFSRDENLYRALLTRSIEGFPSTSEAEAAPVDEEEKTSKHDENFHTVEDRTQGQLVKAEDSPSPLLMPEFQDIREQFSAGSMGAAQTTQSFRRVLHWNFAGLNMLLGSDLVVFRNSEHPAVSLKLQDMNQKIAPLTALDYYLDNLMANVPELAVCLHSEGFVRGYRLVETKDIPYLNGPSVPLFDPSVVHLSALELMKFLKSHCTTEGGTYLLYRESEHDMLRLYDVTSLSIKQQKKWKYMLSMLCFRFALRLSRLLLSPSCPSNVRQRVQERQRQLFNACLNLLRDLHQMGGAGHETICASVEEHIADSYLREAKDIDRGDNYAQKGQPSDNDDRIAPSIEALLSANNHLGHAIDTLQCLRESREDSEGGAWDEAEVRSSGVETEERISFGYEENEDEEDEETMDDMLLLQIMSLEAKKMKTCLDIIEKYFLLKKVQESLHLLSSAVASLSKFVQTNIKSLRSEIFRSNRIEAARHYLSLMKALGDIAIAMSSAASSHSTCFSTIGELHSKLREIGPLLAVPHLLDGEETDMPMADHGEDYLLNLGISCYTYLKDLGRTVDEERRIRQRLGSALNEKGKRERERSQPAKAKVLFEEALALFQEIDDRDNIALLNLNLSSLYRSSAHGKASDAHRELLSSPTPSEHFEQAVRHCENARGALGERKTNAEIWDLITSELAVVHLSWGVHLAQQLLIDEGLVPEQKEERTIEQMVKEASVHLTRALNLYIDLQNKRQTAATYYQLAAFNLKCWQRNKRQANLQVALRYYQKALEYFGTQECGQVFIIIHLDLALLYSSIDSIDCQRKALQCILQTRYAIKNVVDHGALTADIVARLRSCLLHLVRASEAEKEGEKELDRTERTEEYKRLYRKALYVNSENIVEKLSEIAKDHDALVLKT